MAIVHAGPSQFLLVGRGGRLENRGSAVRAVLLPGTIHVLVPGAKQEATFEFTQETSDGIPMRFKGIIVYRISDPILAARQFEFGGAAGTGQITTLLRDVCLGELRHTVSQMTMIECIEQRKTTLSAVVESALIATTKDRDDASNDWGITIELAQVAQVFIVDSELRQQLEAEVRNEIKLKSDQSTIRTDEESRLATMASQERVAEQKLENDREDVRRQEALDLVELARRRRMQAEAVATERQAIALEQERFHAAMEAEHDRVNSEAPVRLLRTTQERDLLQAELAMRRVQNEVRALEVDHGLLLTRAEQALRREILPLEQTPQIVEAASKVLHGANLSIYGEDGQLVGQLAPLFEILGRAVRAALEAGDPATPGAEASV